MDNYINVVGFQLEKVHTGVIKWCFDSDSHPNHQKVKVIELLYKHLGKPIPFDTDKITRVHCTPEYSFGRSVRIDLLIEIYTSESVYRIACEMKVDSDPYKKQLDTIVSQVEGKFSKSPNAEYILILIGSSSVMRNVGDCHDRFSVLTNEDLIQIFSEFGSESHILQDWLFALNEEVDRQKAVLQNFDKLCSSEKVWKKSAHIALGYRPFFSTYYYLYNVIRQHSVNNWQIYSGGNNPVMNLASHWELVDDFEFYWEFNYLEFCLKVRIDPNITSSERLNTLRAKLYPALEAIKVDGFRSQMRYGTWNTIYKWDLRKSIQDPELLLRQVEKEILPSYQTIVSIAISV